MFGQRHPSVVGVRLCRAVVNRERVVAERLVGAAVVTVHRPEGSVDW